MDRKEDKIAKLRATHLSLRKQLSWLPAYTESATGRRYVYVEDLIALLDQDIAEFMSILGES